MGMPVDPTTGNLVGSTPQVLQFQNDFLPAQQTTKVDYRANLASYPLTTAHDKSVVGSELLRPAAFSAGHNPLTLGTPAAPYADATTSGTRAAQQADAPAVQNHRWQRRLSGAAPTRLAASQLRRQPTPSPSTVPSSTSTAAGMRSATSCNARLDYHRPRC